MLKIVLTTVLFSACFRFDSLNICKVIWDGEGYCLDAVICNNESTDDYLASAIHCIECNSVNNSMCLDPTVYDEETLQRYLALTECRDGAFAQGHKEFFCRKIVQTILRKGHEAEVRVSRGCGWVRSRRACYKADNEDHLETVCQCFEDGCNAAGGLRWAMMPLMITCGIALFNK